MSRKNARVARRKTIRKYRENHHGNSTPYMAPVPVEKMVVPKGRCFFKSRRGKLRFSKEDVALALKHAQHNRMIHNSTYTEERYYECSEVGGCGDFHLTSRKVYEVPTRG